MIQIVLIGIAAGIAAALLFLSPIGGTALAFPLFALSALPIAIAGLGWNALAAVVAAIAGAAIVTGAISGSFALAFLALFAAPTVWMSYRAGMSRATGPEPGDIEWFPIGAILFEGAIAAATGVIVIGMLVGYDPDALAEEMTAQLVEWLAESPDAVGLPAAEQLAPFVRFNIAAMPYTLSAILIVVQVFNMWLGSRIAEASGRMQRPRLPLWTAALPGRAPVVFIVALFASLVPGAIGHAAGAFTGALGGALALIGLAVVHATTIGNGLRTLLLVAVYVLLALFGFPILLLAILGIAESFFMFRARRGPGTPAND